MLAYLEGVCTAAELSLGEVLDALPEDSPWLGRLERADEDFGRPLSDWMRLRRWSMVLIDMHYPNLWPHTREEFHRRYFTAVLDVYAFTSPHSERRAFASEAVIRGIRDRLHVFKPHDGQDEAP
jgi:hypothetical protein